MSAELDALRAELARVTAERDAALDALDMISPRPWSAYHEGDPDPEAEWSIEDANGERVASSWGPKDGETPMEWTRSMVATVNALGADGKSDASVRVPAADLIAEIERVLRFPNSRICVHAVAVDLLALLERHGVDISDDLADAVVSADDATALALLADLRKSVSEPVSRWIDQDAIDADGSEP